MLPTIRRTSPPGRVAARWLIFLTLFHLLPIPWYLAVAAGLAPASFLLLLSIASLFNSDSDSLAFALFFSAPALLGGLLIALLAWLLAAAIGRCRTAAAQTTWLALIVAASIGAATQSIYIAGGHGSTESLSLFDFVSVLGQFRIPQAMAIGYFAILTLLIFVLLIWQHLPQKFPIITRRVWRSTLVALFITLLISLGWTHRLMIFVYPFAQFGFPSQQYRLGMALKADSNHPSGGADSRAWFERAAEQGHAEAAMELSRHPRSAEDKRRWLTLAAEGGVAEAQGALAKLLQRSGDPEDLKSAMRWLQTAAKGGDAEAQFLYGQHHARGLESAGIARDPAAARKWWEKSAANGHGPAMAELARRFELGAEGYDRDPQRSIALYEALAKGYAAGTNGLKSNAQMAAGSRQHAENIDDLEKRVAAGETEALLTLGRQLIENRDGSAETRKEGLDLLERAAAEGDAEIQYELGAIFMFGRQNLEKDFERGRPWWDRAAEQHHVRTLEYLAKARQSGQFGYSVDLLKAKSYTAALVKAYSNGGFGVDADPQKANYWTAEFKHFDRLFQKSGGIYLPLDDLRSQAAGGDLAAHYQLGQQLLASGAAADRTEGLRMIELAAAGGHAEAAYRLVTRYENLAQIMRSDPRRGIALLESAAEQGHLRAMETLALAHYKGRYGLTINLREAVIRYERLLATHASGESLGEIDERFIDTQRRHLGYARKALETQEAREKRYAEASPRERQVIAIEDRYRKEYERAVNAIERRDGGKEGKARFRAEVERLRLHYAELRDRELAELP